MGKTYSFDLRSTERENFMWRKYIPAPLHMWCRLLLSPLSEKPDRERSGMIFFKRRRAVETWTFAHACKQLSGRAIFSPGSIDISAKKTFSILSAMGSVGSLSMRGPFLPFVKRRHRSDTFLKRQLAIRHSYLKVDALRE
jgi:hypothetical protein